MADQYGFIYCIENKIDHTKYIGQTARTIDVRWKEHLRNIDQEGKKNLHLYRALKKYGSENFTCYEIEKVPITELNDREKYWIQYYDSYNNGYNSTLGGDGVTLLEVDIDKMRELYEELGNIDKVASILNVSRSLVSDRLKKAGIPVKSFNIKKNFTDEELLQKFNELHGNRKEIAQFFNCAPSTIIYRLNKLQMVNNHYLKATFEDGKEMKFKTMIEAAKYMIKIGKARSNIPQNVVSAISKSISKRNGIAYGVAWEKISKEEYDAI